MSEPTKIKSYSNPLGFVSLSHVAGNCYLVYRPFDPPKMCLSLEEGESVFHNNLRTLQKKYYDIVNKADKFEYYGHIVLPRENK